MNYRIISGYLEISKKLFTKEVMKPGSLLRTLIGLDGKWSKKVEHIERSEQLVVIEYTKDDVIYLEDDIHRFIERIKKDYKEQVKGQITVSKIRGMRDFLDFKVEL